MKPPVSTCNFRQPPCPVSAAVKSWAEGRADFLDELVTTHGYSNIRWYCFANELENNVNFNNWVSSWTIDRPLDTRSDLWFDSIDGPTSHPFCFTYEYSASVQSGPGRRKVLFTKKPTEISRSQWQNNSARDPAGVLGGWLAGWLSGHVRRCARHGHAGEAIPCRWAGRSCRIGRHLWPRGVAGSSAYSASFGDLSARLLGRILQRYARPVHSAKSNRCFLFWFYVRTQRLFAKTGLRRTEGHLTSARCFYRFGRVLARWWVDRCRSFWANLVR